MFKNLGVRLRRFGSLLWRFGPLPFIALIVAVQLGVFSKNHFEELRTVYALLVQFVQSHPVLWLPLTAVAVMVLAYLQNTTYALQSRAGMRNNNFYHFVAAVAASFTYFCSLLLLVRNELPLVLLAPYVLATVFATVQGNQLSIRIEKAFGIYVENLSTSPQLMKLWPSVAVLAGLLIWQVWQLGISGVRVVTHGGGEMTLGIGTLTLLVALGIAGSFSFALLRTARSSDSYWFHAVAFLLNTGVEFLKLAILIKFRLNWQLFLPVTLGSVIGALIGANIALDIVERIKAKFDLHVYGKKEGDALESFLSITRPTKQLQILSLAFLAQAAFILLGWAGFAATVVLTLLSAWQQMSFTLKSRAGQRNNSAYLAWASIFSNGVWYITMKPLAQGSVTWDEAIPYIIGGAIGSLIGQLVAMHVERVTGALAVERMTVPVPTGLYPATKRIFTR